MNKKTFPIILSFFLCILLCSCGSLGYSLVLWNNSEAGVSEGQIVKVYVKSNISQSYIISLPESKQKIEIPLWQISEPQGKRKTLDLANSYKEYEHTYASVKLDGLPIRLEPVNTAKQVYRLRKDEIIRILYKGNGQSVTNGKGNLNGEWLRVLTSSGTFGWCFSYNLNLFERTGQKLENSSEGEIQELDEAIKDALLKRWYPEYFQQMIKTGRFDLEKISANYGFFFGLQNEDENEDEDETSVEENFDMQIPDSEYAGEQGNPEFAVEIQNENEIDSENQIKDAEPNLNNFMFDENAEKTARILTSDLNKEWTYKKINAASDGAYVLGENQVYITLKGKNFMAVQYMDSDGKMKSENFVALNMDFKEVIKKETERRNSLIQSFVQDGPIYRSSNYGTLTFKDGGNAVWRNFRLLVPSVISATARENIKVTCEYYLSPSLQKEFDGILTFKFEGSSEKVNFFYKKDSSGVRLEDAKRATFKGNLVTARSSSPLVMYFTVR
ncbi:SH3 domain-containing protein [Treponema pectinovorum]|uniref:SH3 domain-containing protein n=1 Tax=Treponema pectinovorum TaxID=164 RepID=UPI0011C9E236|nr:SH3 domain-containing protein [Treponema pectinovorum]